VVSDAASTLIQSLQAASAFPHSVTSIELHETHISWVLLTGPFAYKIKKPVNLRFVDFTSLSRRRFFCEEELRLNRRLAPDLYLDVLPICGTEQAPRIGGPGTPLEWCVRMRQFDQECLLTRLVGRRGLTSNHIDALARQIVEFHARIPMAGPESLFGTPAAVAEPILANFEHLNRPEPGIEPALVEGLRAWCETEVKRLEEILANRKSEGFVRECHGDMHLGNMILEGDVIKIFDCIEFNESLRWIDVMSEIAFCTMDLEDHGRTDLAWRFLNSVLEWSGDFAGLKVFPLYFTYRALVSAKVAQIRREQPVVSAAAKDHELKTVCNYLKLAGRSLTQRPQFLAITHGLSGSGKTRGPQDILERCGAIRIRSDVERKRLAGLVPSATTSSEIAGGIYTPEFTRQTFARLADLSVAVVDAGFPLIVDATFLRCSERNQFRSLAETLRIPFVILDFPADEATCRERIRLRAHQQTDASEATEQVLDGQLRSREPLSDQEQRFTVRFNRDWPETIEAMLADADTPFSA
jgi:uncharacterized protein